MNKGANAEGSVWTGTAPDADHKTTPAAGVADHRWTMLESVEMLEKEEKLRGGRITECLPSSS